MNQQPSPRDKGPAAGKQRIAIVNDVAGVGRVHARLLAEAGFEVDFYPLPILGGRLPTLLKAMVAPIRLARYLPIVRKIRLARYDVVHVHFVSQGMVGMFSKAPFVVHAHGSDLRQNLNKPLIAWLTRRVLKAADWIIYVTPDLERYLGEYTVKATLIENTVDPLLPHGLLAPAAISRVLIFARLEALKGADEIFAHMPEIAKGFQITAVASGEWAGEYRLRYRDIVTFVKTVPHERIGFFLGGFDAVVGQMREGVLGLSELEALACGRPLLMRLESSFYRDDPPPVVDVKDGASIAPALRKLARDPVEIERLGRAGPVWIRRNHSPQTYVRRLAEIYARVSQRE